MKRVVYICKPKFQSILAFLVPPFRNNTSNSQLKLLAAGFDLPLPSVENSNQVRAMHLGLERAAMGQTASTKLLSHVRDSTVTLTCL